MHNEQEDTRTYEVVMNGEEQYSIWLADRPIPAGWVSVGKRGLKSECLEHVGEVWTDMRPLSLRRPADDSRSVSDHGVSIPLVHQLGLLGHVTAPMDGDAVTNGAH